MRHLILLRHAKTERDSASGEDYDRRLDERGELDSALIGAWLAAQRVKPELALVSSAVRARETWEIVAPHLPGCRAEFQDALYLANPLQIFKAIRSVPDSAASLLVLGHNPGLHELAWNLIGEAPDAAQAALAQNLPTSGAVTFDCPISAWPQLALQANKLRDFMTPKQLKADSDAP